MMRFDFTRYLYYPSWPEFRRNSRAIHLSPKLDSPRICKEQIQGMTVARDLALYFLICGFSAASYAAAPTPAEKYKTNSPIEINADQLSVFQAENRAVFSGHVVAIQGAVHLKSDNMEVFYRPPEEKSGDKPGAPKPPKPAAGATPDKDAIKRIEVHGNVFLATPEETASGDNGTYDVENHQILLNTNVVLTRGQNVLKGSKLVYDFNTGKSVITGGAGAAAQPGQPTQTSGRVRALFVPGSNDGQKK